MHEKPVIALLLGDAAGVGPEIVAKMLVSGEATKYCRPLLLGDRRVLADAFQLIGGEVPVKEVGEEQIGTHPEPELLHLPHPELAAVRRGELNTSCGAACVEMIIKAVELYRRGKVQGICYAPLNKGALQKADPTAKSELHLFVKLLGHEGTHGELNMLDNIWTTRVTSHIPLSQVSASLTREDVLAHIELLDKTLRRAGFASPRIGVAAVNPHGGEGGLCGREEIDVIRPAMEEAAAEGIVCAGLYPADILFIKAFNGEMDGVVTMYHDQGQIALKLKGFERGVTIAGGLDVPITTCAHGTAYDIAWLNRAGTGSLANALHMASVMASYSGVQH